MLPFDTLVLNKYRILRSPNRRDGLLGKGTFGNVYLAHEELADRDVAIKELGLEAGDLEGQQEEALKRFLTEGRLGLRIRHPNILEVYAIEPYDDGYLLVMELAESGDLKGLLGRGRPELRRAIEIAVGIALGLQAAHERGIVHRDLKPGNVFMMQDGTPKVADFGVAHIPQAVGGYLTMTRTGFQPGTVIYMSPEQAYGRKVDHRSDLYSLSVMMFELLTGSFYVDMQKCRELAQSQSATTPALEELKFFQAFMDLAFSGHVPRPSERNPAVPPWLDEVVMRGLAGDPDERWQSGREFAAALRAGPAPLDATIVAAPQDLDATLVEPLTPATLGRGRRPNGPPPATGVPMDMPTSRYTGPVAATPGDTIVSPAPATGYPLSPAASADTLVAPATAADTLVAPSPPAEAMYIKPPPTGSRLGTPAALQPGPDATYVAPVARSLPADRPSTGNGVAAPAHEQPTVVVTALNDGTAASAAARRAPLDEINTPRQARPPAARATAPPVTVTPAPAATSARKRPLWLLIGAAVAALAVGGGVVFALKGGGNAKPTPTPAPTVAPTQAPSTAVVTNPATVVPASTSTTTSSPSPTPAPKATPVPNDQQVTDDVLLKATSHPTATEIDRQNIDGPSGDAGAVAMLSRIAGRNSGDCAQNFFDVFRPDANGNWASVWDGSKLPDAAQPLLGPVARTDAGCLPDVNMQRRPLQPGGPDVVLVRATNSDGQRVVVVQYDAKQKQVVTRDNRLFNVPGTQIAFFDPANTPNAGYNVLENAYPPLNSGLNPDYGTPTGQFAEALVYNGSAFGAGGQHLVPSCMSGTLQLKGNNALLFSCPDGSFSGQSAVAITGDTTFADGVSFADLQAGDDVTVTLADGYQPGDALSALPPAASIQSSQAAYRKRPTPAPTQPPVSPPRTGTGSTGTTTQPTTPRSTTSTGSTGTTTQPPVSQPPVATQPPASTGGGAGLGGGTGSGSGGAGLGGGGSSGGGGAGLGGGH